MARVKQPGTKGALTPHPPRHDHTRFPLFRLLFRHLCRVDASFQHLSTSPHSNHPAFATTPSNHFRTSPNRRQLTFLLYRHPSIRLPVLLHHYTLTFCSSAENILVLANRAAFFPRLHTRVSVTSFCPSYGAWSVLQFHHVGTRHKAGPPSWSVQEGHRP